VDAGFLQGLSQLKVRAFGALWNYDPPQPHIIPVGNDGRHRRYDARVRDLVADLGGWLVVADALHLGQEALGAFGADPAIADRLSEPASFACVIEVERTLSARESTALAARIPAWLVMARAAVTRSSAGVLTHVDFVRRKFGESSAMRCRRAVLICQTMRNRFAPGDSAPGIASANSSTMSADDSGVDLNILPWIGPFRVSLLRLGLLTFDQRLGLAVKEPSD
jgi:hypothetical protein